MSTTSPAACGPAFVLPCSDSTLTRYHQRIEALVRRYALWPSVRAWVDPDDYRSEAWEAVYHVLARYPALPELDRDNVTLAAARNALINLRVSTSRSIARTCPRRMRVERLPDPHDHLGEVTTAVWIEQVAATMRPQLRALFLATAELAGAGQDTTAVVLAKCLGVCPDTAKARRQELRRVIRGFVERGRVDKRVRA